MTGRCSFPRCGAHTTGELWLHSNETAFPAEFSFGLVNVVSRSKVLIQCLPKPSQLDAGAQSQLTQKRNLDVQNGWLLFEFSNSQLKDDMDACIDSLDEFLTYLSSGARCLSAMGERSYVILASRSLNGSALKFIREDDMKNWKVALRIILYLALAVAGFLIFNHLATRQPLRFGANEAPETQKIGVIFYGYGITLIGVVLGAAYRELQARREKGETQLASVTGFATSVLRSIDFWLSLCGSPIVYALLWKSLEGGNQAGLTIMALQNGFCCTMVVGALLKRGPDQPAADAGNANFGG
jgi:hypothetical protein